jgi:hypothetical protein
MNAMITKKRIIRGDEPKPRVDLLFSGGAVYSFFDASMIASRAASMPA